MTRMAFMKFGAIRNVNSTAPVLISNHFRTSYLVEPAQSIMKDDQIKLSLTSKLRMKRHSSFRLFCSNQNNTESAHSDLSGKSQIVFLGTPQVAAQVLERLLKASQSDDSLFEVAAVVTQPPSSRGRGRRKEKLLPTPVAELAIQHGFPEERILTPASAKEPSFLSFLSSIQPTLCVTAAYGNFLPPAFLSLPSRGTVNIHPSLLPLYRGASPVQRALEDGVEVTGVTLAFTVAAMDAGPVIASHSVTVDDEVKAPQLLEELFAAGSDLLLNHMAAILDGSAAELAVEQLHENASRAPKVSAEEGVLQFNNSAQSLHNKVRAFAGWPGTQAIFKLVDEEKGKTEEVPLKIITTTYVPASLSGNNGQKPSMAVCLKNGALEVTCDDGSILRILEVQPPSKQKMNSSAFWNGLRGRMLFRL